MFHNKPTNLSPKGETFEHFGAFVGITKTNTTKLTESFTHEGERLRERFKSHKSLYSHIYKKNIYNLSPIHPTHARATRYAHARIGCR